MIYKNIKIAFVSLILAACPIPVLAQVVSEAETLLEAGDTHGALTFLRTSILESPKASDAGIKNYLAAKCALALSLYGEARDFAEAAKDRGVADAWLLSAQLDLSEYDFSGAESELKNYTSFVRKNKKTPSPEAARLENSVKRASSFMSGVEKIAVLDSISLPADDFFGAYRLSPAAGAFRASSEIIGFPDGMDVKEPVYVTESGDRILFSAIDPDTGNYAVFECVSMSDGSLSEPVWLDLGIDGNCAYPFLMPDGVTLYFASDGEESIGGYDLFVSVRDSSSGEFLQPSNLGFPYNSPKDDILLAIDEESGYGWWTTDRNSLPGETTLLVYTPGEIRENYDIDNENLTALAKIDPYRLTWGEADLSDAVERLRSLSFEEEQDNSDFNFPVGKGVVLTRFDQLTSNASRDTMEKYIAASNEYSELLITLGELRRKYAVSPSDSLSAKILRMEQKLADDGEELYKIRNEIYSLEKINLK